MSKNKFLQNSVKTIFLNYNFVYYFYENKTHFNKNRIEDKANKLSVNTIFVKIHLNQKIWDMVPDIPKILDSYKEDFRCLKLGLRQIHNRLVMLQIFFSPFLL